MPPTRGSAKGTRTQGDSVTRGTPKFTKPGIQSLNILIEIKNFIACLIHQLPPKSKQHKERSPQHNQSEQEANLKNKIFNNSVEVVI